MRYLFFLVHPAHFHLFKNVIKKLIERNHTVIIAITPESRYFYPLAKTLLLPSCCDVGMWEKKRVTYEGYHELAYLHPDNFFPNKEVIRSFNKDNKPYMILRLVNFTASHDRGKSGFKIDFVKRLITLLKKSGEVFITSEKKSIKILTNIGLISIQMKYIMHYTMQIYS